MRSSAIWKLSAKQAKGVSAELRSTSPHIPWKSMATMRDRLIHHYFGVNLDIVWQVVSKELPELAPEFDNLIEGNAE
jgi:uncharacterized protein with HEPN domain